MTAAVPSTLKAALWMAGSIASFIVMSVAGRAVRPSLDTFQVMEMRSVIGFVMLLPLVHMAGGLKAMRTQRPLQHIGRNVAHYAGQFGWLHALTMIPLAELVSIEFTTPIWTALLAVPFLGEKLNRRKIAAIAIGMVGVLIIVRPGSAAIQTGHLIILASAVMFAIAVVMVKSLTRTDNVVRIIFWMLIIQSLIGLVPAIQAWRDPPAELWPWILVISFTGTSAHYCAARALVHADATVVMPMDFLRLPFTAAVGWLLYSEAIDAFTALGALLILAGNFFNIQRRSAQAQTTAP